MLQKIFKDTKTENTSWELDTANIPAHVAIIMDGNGRWAKKRGMPRSFGHRAGAETLKRIVRAASDLGIKTLTVYAFSTENWKRPEEEVSLLMGLFEEYLKKNILDLKENDVRMKFVGHISGLSKKLQDIIAETEKDTACNKGLVLNIAINYGGRDELVHAMQKIGERVKQGNLLPEEIDENTVAQYLYTAPDAEVDLLIRPGSDCRISNFLLWQIAYAELWFTEQFWPDFTKETLLEAIAAYQSRERRFGGLK